MFNRRRVSLSIFAGAALAVPLALVGVGLPAYADASVADWNTLQTEVTGAAAADTITLTADITADPNESLLVNVGATVTLDLAGNNLSIASPASGEAGIGVPTGATLIISDNVGRGILTVLGGEHAAGIGGGNGEDGGTVTITGGTVTAIGAPDSSGIGGSVALEFGPDGLPGTLQISGTPDGTATTGGGSLGAPITDTAPDPAGLFYTATVSTVPSTGTV